MKAILSFLTVFALAAAPFACSKKDRSSSSLLKDLQGSWIMTSMQDDKMIEDLSLVPNESVLVSFTGKQVKIWDLSLANPALSGTPKTFTVNGKRIATAGSQFMESATVSGVTKTNLDLKKVLVVQNGGSATVDEVKFKKIALDEADELIEAANTKRLNIAQGKSTDSNPAILSEAVEAKQPADWDLILDEGEKVEKVNKVQEESEFLSAKYAEKISRLENLFAAFEIHLKQNSMDIDYAEAQIQSMNTLENSTLLALAPQDRDRLMVKNLRIKQRFVDYVNAKKAEQNNVAPVAQPEPVQPDVVEPSQAKLDPVQAEEPVFEVKGPQLPDTSKGQPIMVDLEFDDLSEFDQATQDAIHKNNQENIERLDALDQLDDDPKYSADFKKALSELRSIESYIYGIMDQRLRGKYFYDKEINQVMATVMDSARKYSGHVQNLNTEEQKFMEAVSNEISAGMELKLKILQSE